MSANSTNFEGAPGLFLKRNGREGLKGVLKQKSDVGDSTVLRVLLKQAKLSKDLVA